MSPILIIQTVQFLFLIFIVAGIIVQTFKFVVKYKVFKEVYGKNINGYIEAKILEKQFEVNRARDAKK